MNVRTSSMYLKSNFTEVVRSTRTTSNGIQSSCLLTNHELKVASGRMFVRSRATPYKNLFYSAKNTYTEKAYSLFD
jgi:hypothetical protein